MHSAGLFLGAVALELVPGAQPARLRLGPATAARCADGIANDLARLLPQTAALDLCLVGALYDPAELLRPRWPVHAALAALLARAPGERGGRVLAFGSADGCLPEAALEPDAQLAGGPLRLLPWLLAGPAADVAAVGAQLEELLLERGMADAASALALQDAFSVPLEHVRHATLHDLCALTAAQYRHAALDGVWNIVEHALLHAGSTYFTASDGPPLLWTGERVLLGTLDAAAWRTSSAALASSADGPRSFAYWEMRERQLRAVLQAHGLEVIAVRLLSLEQAQVQLREAATGAPSP